MLVKPLLEHFHRICGHSTGRFSAWLCQPRTAYRPDRLRLALLPSRQTANPRRLGGHIFSSKALVFKLLVVGSSALSVLHSAPLPPAPEPIEEILRLQLFLDGQLFGPGKIDGRPGEFTTKALNRYQRSLGYDETPIEEHELDLAGTGELYTRYTIREEDFKFVGDLPSEPSAQSKKKYLPYSSLLEFLTEKFHASPELLEHINPDKKMSALKAGDVIQVPNVRPFLIESLKPVARFAVAPEFKSRHIKIDTVEKMLDLYEGDTLLASLPITPGSGHVATPPGKWRILGITQLPTFRWDKSVLEYGVRSKNFYELPMGPNNPVGIMWIGLNKPGIGIHGTNQPQTIGRSASHGCMRTANWDVTRLVSMITKDMTVIIEGPPPVPRPVKAAPGTGSRQQQLGTGAPASEPKKRFRWFWQRS